MSNDVFLKIKSDGEMLGISRFYAEAKHIIVGFSGGADSSLLLSYFVHLRDTVQDFPKISAVHVNHMLRGEESYNDEEFCRDRCRLMGVPLTVCRINIPELMEKTGLGAEECARNERYSAFAKAADELDGAGVLVATAHNADDNLETVLFNLVRGTGASGLSGIPPVRGGNVIRPLLGMGSADIRDTCNTLGIPFVVDRTNVDEEYTRNFIRHSVVPLLKKVNPAAASSALRAGVTLREDEDFLRGLALDAVGKYLPKDSRVQSVEIPRNALATLAPPVLSRAIIMAVAAVTDIAVSAAQVQTCRRLITDAGTGALSLPDKVTLEVSKCSVTVTKALRAAGEFYFDIDLPPVGECLKYSCAEGGFDLYLARRESDIVPDAENIYKLSINTAVRFDTIYGRIFVRQRLPGDTLFLGGHTRRLKKMICDRGIPESRRDRLPVICDDDGVLLVPGLPVRGPAYARECDMDENVLHVLYCLYEHF